jgi:hypothetical protein
MTAHSKSLLLGDSRPAVPKDGAVVPERDGGRLVGQADTRRPAEAPQKCRVTWLAEHVEMEVLPADVTAIQRQASALVADARQRLGAVSEQAGTGAEATEAKRLQQALAEAQEKLVPLAEALALAKATQQQGIVQGVSVSTAEKHDAAVDKAQRQVTWQTARIEHLGRLVRDAHTKAAGVAQNALRQVRAEISSDWSNKHRQALQTLCDALQSPLAELLALGMALDSLA